MPRSGLRTEGGLADFLNQLEEAERGRRQKREASYAASEPMYEDIMAAIQQVRQGTQTDYRQPQSLYSLRNMPGLRQNIGAQSIIAPYEHGDMAQGVTEEWGPLGFASMAAAAPLYQGAKLVNQGAPAHTAGGRLMDFIAQKFAGGSRSKPQMKGIYEVLKGAMRGLK